MRVRFIATNRLIQCVGAIAALSLIALLTGIAVTAVAWATAAAVILLASICAIDALLTWRRWQQAQPQLSRRMPRTLALGVTRPVSLTLSVQGERHWRLQLFDHSDASLNVTGMPANVRLSDSGIELTYHVTPTQRGIVNFAPADVWVTSHLTFLQLRDRLGSHESCRVYPDFAQVARYAWLAGDRRLSEIGIKTFRQRGEGTDFKQLSEYRVGDPLRHLDWKATLRFDKPIIREFQNERDQCVMLLIDCGRRMRAEDRDGKAQQGIGSAHFDQVLNAVMLLSYVALKQGDAVGAMTFGTPPGGERWFSPRKGAITLNALMGELYAVQPTPTHSDYLVAARDLLKRQHKRALIIVITNFRDEDASEFGQALTLLRSRHLVMAASLREAIVGQLASQPIADAESIIEIASAHLYEQARRDAFQRLAARNALMVDAEPERLGVELVNRYQALKRAGLI